MHDVPPAMFYHGGNYCGHCRGVRIVVKKVFFALLLVLGLGLYQHQGGNLENLLRDTQESTVTSGPGAQERELQKTLARIRSNGPYPYERDGITFENRERRLPAKARGYYREFTVDTPGLSHRGPRRVVTGGHPPEVFYYTEDHYRTFTRIQGE